MTSTSNPLIDTQDFTIEIEVDTNEMFRDIRLFGSRIVNDSLGRPVEHFTNPLHLTPDLAVELARRLLNAAAALR